MSPYSLSLFFFSLQRVKLEELEDKLEDLKEAVEEKRRIFDDKRSSIDNLRRENQAIQRNQFDAEKKVAIADTSIQNLQRTIAQIQEEKAQRQAQLQQLEVEKKDKDLGNLKLPFTQEFHFDDKKFLIETKLDNPQENIENYSKNIEITPKEENGLPTKTNICIKS
jgi:chromosome segregation protein